MQTLTKICENCKAEKSISEFYKNKAGIPKLKVWCKKCVVESGYWKEHYQKSNMELQKEKKRQYYKENPEPFKKSRKEYYEKNRLKILAKQKEVVQNNPDIHLRKSMAGMRQDTNFCYSVDQLCDFYNKQFASQKGCCAICGRHESEFKYRLSIDHDHETCKLRGLLCSNCNTAIGSLQDDAELCLKAYNYLRKN
jgi:hypothetical protein